MTWPFRRSRVVLVTTAFVAVLTLFAGSPERRIDASLAALRTGARARDSIHTPSDIVAMLDRSCTDCHSASTRWPWYSAIPPVNLLLATDVRNGRDDFLLPGWSGGRSGGRVAWMNLGAACYDVRNGIMPPRGYRWLHGTSAWSPAEIDRFCRWAQGLRDSLKTGDSLP